MTPKGHAIPSKTQLLSYGTPAFDRGVFAAPKKRQRYSRCRACHWKRQARSPGGLPHAAEERNCAVMVVLDLDMILQSAQFQLSE